MDFDNAIADAKEAYKNALGVADFMRSEMFKKVDAVIESAIYTLYGFKKGLVINIKTDSLVRNYAIQCFQISAPDILNNDTALGIIDRARVVLRETDDLGRLIMGKSTVTCHISDIKLNSIINQ